MVILKGLLLEFNQKKVWLGKPDKLFLDHSKKRINPNFKQILKI